MPPAPWAWPSTPRRGAQEAETEGAGRACGTLVAEEAQEEGHAQEAGACGAHRRRHHAVATLGGALRSVLRDCTTA